MCIIARHVRLASGKITSRLLFMWLLQCCPFFRSMKLIAMSRHWNLIGWKFHMIDLHYHGISRDHWAGNGPRPWSKHGETQLDAVCANRPSLLVFYWYPILTSTVFRVWMIWGGRLSTDQAISGLLEADTFKPLPHWLPELFAMRIRLHSPIPHPPGITRASTALSPSTFSF